MCRGRCPPEIGTAGSPVSIATGILALLICVYLAAVYLAWESHDTRLREDFRRRALAIRLAGVTSMAVLLLPPPEAMAVDRPDVVAGGPVHRRRIGHGAALVRGPARRPLSLAATPGVAQIVALLALGGGAVACTDYRDVTVTNASAPASTLALTAWTLPLASPRCCRPDRSFLRVQAADGALNPRRRSGPEQRRRSAPAARRARGRPAARRPAPPGRSPAGPARKPR